MKSGKMAGQATAVLCADRTQAKRAGPDLGIRAVGVSDGSPKGRDSRNEARCKARQRDPAKPGDARLDYPCWMYERIGMMGAELQCDWTRNDAGIS